MIHIYNVYHKAAHILKNECIVPIQVGSGTKIDDIDVRDNTHDNISDRNSTFCELTAQYWIWKNDLDSDYLGLFHYRRYLNLQKVFSTPSDKNESMYGMREISSFTSNFQTDLGLNPDNIENVVEDADIILPLPWDVSKLGYKNIYQHYVKSKYHHKRDIDKTRTIIKEIYPDYLDDFDSVMESSVGIWTNMFIFKKEYFNKYSKWLFDILFELEKNLDISYYDVQEKRVFGYLSERLINVWLVNLMRINPDIKIKYAERIFVKDTSEKKFMPKDINPKFIDKAISIVVSSDNNYVPHMGALISSICMNLGKENYLDLIILNGGISKNNFKLIEKQLEISHINYQVSFIDLFDEFLDLNVHMHFSRATFYRLMLSKLLLNREKVLYLDTDIIVLDDISKLYNINIDNYSLAACHDYIMEGFCLKSIPSISGTGGIPAKQYLQDYVGLGNNYKDYFQAGVILFNLKKIREMNVSDLMIESLTNKKYWFLDQDVLNKYFVSTALIIDSSWNFVNCIEDLIDDYSGTSKVKLLNDIHNYKIIHYAGYDVKPWINPDAHYNEYYFYHLRQTFWYEQVVNKGKFALKNKLVSYPDKSFLWKLARSIWIRLPLFLKRRLSGLKDYLYSRI